MGEYAASKQFGLRGKITFYGQLDALQLRSEKIRGVTSFLRQTQNSLGVCRRPGNVFDGMPNLRAGDA